MRIFAWILFSLLTLAFAQEKITEEKITQEELQIINTLSQNILSKSSHYHKPHSIAWAFNYIWEHRKVRINPLLERINFELQGFKGIRRSIIQSDLGSYQYYGGNLTISILDEKERREKQAEILKQKTDIIKILESYFRLKQGIKQDLNKREILKIKETRLKARVLQGVENLTERLKNLNDLLAINEKIEIDTIKTESLKLQIIEIVEPNYQAELEKQL